MKMISPMKQSRNSGLAAAVFAAHLFAPVARAEAATDFQREIRPILSNICFKCHGPDQDERKGGKKGSGGLRLDTEEGSRADLDGARAVVPGHPEQSDLIARITSADPDELMPPPKSGKKLSPREIEAFTHWIKGGAKYSKHWSYEKPVRPVVPTIADCGLRIADWPVDVRPEDWSTNPIDAFVLQRMAKEGLKPSPLAMPEALVRRMTLDLTGLPPTPEDADAFVAESIRNPQSAIRNLADRLLASSAYGEHWGRAWLDLARYADSAGYADDPPRTIWAYRDYVIRAFNANMPFDQFTIEQLGGDLLPNPTEDQIIATAFHRNTMTNSEGGTDDEEFRNAAVVDRANTTMSVWMGTSFACAQCHTHKFDPITNAEYFRLFAFLNNTADSDKKDEQPVIDLDLLTAEQKAQRAKLQERLATLDGKIKELTAPGKIADPEVKKARDEATALRKQIENLRVTVPVMRELVGAQRRKTKIQLRGNFLALSDEVTEGVPAAFHPLPKDAPMNRLTLARWLVDDANPLTARVIANRFWESIFGIGIVRTSEEFGAQGEPPSHPELLDWLATELVREKWDAKKFLKLLVTSATYRQSSKVTPELAERDPDNRLLARGPRFRMGAEMVRDQALAVSGLLSRKMYGPSVRPPRPNMGLSAAFGGGLDWATSAGEDMHRRALYTEWRRTAPYPSMVTFDAPNREVCTLRRNRTNTPLQALVTLNDPVYIEAAQALARRMVAAGASAEEKVRAGFRLTLTRTPSDTEMQRLVALHDTVLATYRQDEKKAVEMATNPIGPVPKGADVADLAAWTAVANTLLNLDETVMKR